MTTVDSRWSCKPDLGPDGSTCSITYTLADPLDVVGLNVGERHLTSKICLMLGCFRHPFSSMIKLWSEYLFVSRNLSKQETLETPAVLKSDLQF